MNRKREYDLTYMKMAENISQLSHANRAKVGCVIVSDEGQVISHGWNGTPSGFDNCCEIAECSCLWRHGCQYRAEKIENPDIEFCIKAADGQPCDKLKLITKDEVLHAESNAIAKCAKFGNCSTNNSTVYVTLSPCKECAKLMMQCGIKRVVYKDTYRDLSGVNFLRNCNVKVECILNPSE